MAAGVFALENQDNPSYQAKAVSVKNTLVNLGLTDGGTLKCDALITDPDLVKNAVVALAGAYNLDSLPPQVASALQAAHVIAISEQLNAEQAAHAARVNATVLLPSARTQDVGDFVGGTVLAVDHVPAAPIPGSLDTLLREAGETETFDALTRIVSDGSSPPVPERKPSPVPCSCGPNCTMKLSRPGVNVSSPPNFRNNMPLEPVLKAPSPKGCVRLACAGRATS